MSRSAWAKFATYISFHGGLFLGPMNDGAPFVEMFRLLISEEECELGVHIPNKPTSVEKIAADAKVPVDRAAAMLKHMSQKGACFERVTADGKCFYNVTPCSTTPRRPDLSTARFRSRARIIPRSSATAVAAPAPV